MMLNRPAWAVVALCALSATATPVMAQTSDPAAQVVDGLDNALIATMKTGGGIAARARVIGPAVDHAFDLPLMARLSVGPAWTGFSPQEQAGVVAAFRAMSVAQYAANFDSYSSEKFTLVGPVEVRGTDRLVRTTLTGPKGVNEALNYRLRESGGQWKIIDVFYRNAISQLATRRSDFAAVLAKGGAPALISHLNRLAANPK
jgi:phospholipid transport system substrate-binding protein